jgi:ABC-2 type transport system permease protein
MNFKSQMVALETLTRKEVARVLRIWTQTLLPPVITSTIYFVVFGAFLGSRIQMVGDFSYIQFILPGLIMMTAITNSFSNVASSFFSAKFQRCVEELVVAPLHPLTILFGYASGGVVRGCLCGALVTLVGLGFTKITVAHPLYVICFLVFTSTMFSLAGLINGLLAKRFDDIGIIPTFVLTPLTYFAGVFYSISIVPEPWRKLSLFNPIFYLVGGFRYGFLGIHDAPLWQGWVLLVGANVALTVYCSRLFLNGTGLRT